MKSQQGYVYDCPSYDSTSVSSATNMQQNGAYPDPYARYQQQQQYQQHAPQNAQYQQQPQHPQQHYQQQYAQPQHAQHYYDSNNNNHTNNPSSLVQPLNQPLHHDQPLQQDPTLLDTAWAQFETARRKLQLVQEKLKLDQELLQQDKRNFARRMRAAKRRHARSNSSSSSIKHRHSNSSASNISQVQILQERIQELESQVFKSKGSKDNAAQAGSGESVPNIIIGTDIDDNDGVDSKKEKAAENSKDETKNAISIDEGQPDEELLLVRKALSDELESENNNDTESAATISSLQGVILDLRKTCLQQKFKIDQQQAKLDAYNKPTSSSGTLPEDPDPDVIRTCEKSTEIDTASAQTRSTTNVTCPHCCEEYKADKKNVESINRSQIIENIKDTEAEASETGVVQITDDTTDENVKWVLDWDYYDSKNNDSNDDSDNDENDDIGGVYTGTLLRSESLPHGHGTLRWDDGAVYIGDWQNGKRHGQGVYLNAEGDIYQGGWSNDLYHSETASILLWADGRWYRGGYNQGQRHGQGKQTWPFGAHYEGRFEHDKRQGYGVYVYADGRQYSGNYKDDRPHGQGVLLGSDKSTILHEGLWEFGEFVE